MLQDFYMKNKPAVARLVRQFLDKDLFVAFPKWRGKASAIVVGSVAVSNYDKFSDIDLNLIFKGKKDRDAYSLKELKEYKNALRRRAEPVQIHQPMTIQEVEDELRPWSKDGIMREYVRALVVTDPGRRFARLRGKYRWYPTDVYKEKVNWLFAEAFFEYHERFGVAVNRREEYFSEVLKIKIVRLLLNAVLLAHRRFPAFDKHLFQDVGRLPKLPRGFLKAFEDLVGECDPGRMHADLSRALKATEKMLVAKRLIPERDCEYWVGLRPKYKVQVGG